MVSGVTFADHPLLLGSGERLFIYTDGLVEGWDAGGERPGVKIDEGARFAALASGTDVHGGIAALEAALEGIAAPDDTTVIALASTA
jgi:Stage II sporulation protein E (SpoIIE)